jgi:glycosyltransferase involved in cell wall biosynthesis
MLLAFYRNKGKISNYTNSNCNIELIKIPELSSNMTKGFYSIKNRITTNNLIYSKDWNIFGRVYFPSMQKRILNLLNSESFDIIYAQYLLCSYLYNLKTKIPIILDFSHPTLYALNQLYRYENSPMEKFFYILKYLSFWQEAKKYEKFDAGIYVSEIHRKLSKPFTPKKSFIIPPGVDMEYYKPSFSFSNSPSLVFVGNMRYPFNIYSIIYFFRRVYPLIKKSVPNVKFYVVGRNPPNKIKDLSQNDRSIIITGEVKDVRSYISKSHVVVVPIVVDDGGIKTKILEAMAMGKPVVSTSLGSQGIGATHGENIIVSDNAQDFAEQVINLLQDDGLRRRIGCNAREFVERNYSWKRLTDLMNKALEEVANG